MVAIFTTRSRSAHFLRVLLTLALTLGAIGLSVNGSSAAPASPTVTTLTETVTGSTADVRVNFTKGDSSIPAGYKYSTDGGVTWGVCDSSDCRWTSDNTYVVIQKMSSENNAMRNGSTYQIVLQACGTKSGGVLSNCSGDSTVVYYKVGTGVLAAAVPSITTSSTVSHGALDPAITVSGSSFETVTANDSFTVSVGATGLVFSTVTRVDSSTLTFNFTGIAKYGTISIQAKMSAYFNSPTANSNTISVSVPSSVPETPTALTRSAISDSQVHLEWSAPTYNGGSAITNYLIYYMINGGSTWDSVTVGNVLTTNITGLSALTSYVFKVQAKNANGVGPFTATSSAVTTLSGPTVPETPTAVSAGSATTTSLQVSFTAPSNNGGATITAYWLQYSSDNGSTWDTATASATTSPYTVNGLAASTSYVFRVAALNSVGWGPFSDSSTAVSTSAVQVAPAVVVYPPKIEKLNKLKVCARGDDTVIIHGNNLAKAAVTIDGVAVKIRNNSSQTIGVTFDETLEGLKTIRVTTDGGSDTISVLFKNVEKTAFKVFDIPYIYKGGSFLYIFEAFGENTFRVTGNMPDGLVLNAETGEISGTPTEEGVFNFVLHADGVCGNDVDVIRLDVDKEIPNAISHRIKFPHGKVNKMGAREQKELKDFIKEIKKISPRNIEPIIYISGGAPEGEAEVDSEEAKARRDSICDMMLTQDLIAQTVAGLFSGEDDEIEIFVYWPVVR